MAATAEQIIRVRRMTAESGDTSPYSDADMATYIETYPLMDSSGYDPDDSEWTPTYDLNAAAADIWEEKAANFVANGAVYETDSAHAMAMRQCRYFRAKRTIKGVQMKVEYYDETTGS